MKIIILAGGSGTRLWPLSRKSYPKQFVKFDEGGTSLFQDTFNRALLLTEPDAIYVVTNAAQKTLVIKDVEDLGHVYPQANILLEPEAKNTLPAIYAGVHEILKSGDDSVLVFSSDHSIGRAEYFAGIIQDSLPLAEKALITFGIAPDGPNTGYGYICPGESLLNGYEVEAFKEKPAYNQAVEYIQKGYFWNAGIFLFKARLFEDEVKRLAPEIYAAFASSQSLVDAFAAIETKISIDYGIMEKSDKVAVVPADIGWSDLGSFDALHEISKKDENHNVVDANSVLIDSSNNFIHKKNGKLVTAVGIEELIIVDSDDALLVCRKNDSQRVKEIVGILNQQKNTCLDEHMVKVESWGEKRSLDKSKRYSVERLTIRPDKAYVHQSECYGIQQLTILQGLGQLQRAGQVKSIACGASIALPEDQYTITNNGSVDMECMISSIED